MSNVAKAATDGIDAGAFSVYDTEINLYLQLLKPYNSLTAQECAVEYFRRLLVHDHVPSAPVADVLIKSLIRCLRVNYGNIRRDAAWALTNCACAPHEICYKIIQYGGLEALIECATVTDGETRDQVFWAIGNIALDCPLCQAKVRESAALPLMIGILVGPVFTSCKWKRNLIWAMAQILRGGIHTVPIVYLQTALNGLSSVLYLDDQKLKVDATWAVAYIADDAIGGRQIDAVLGTPRLLGRLIELLEDTNTTRAALRALGNLVAGGDGQTQAVLDAGLLSHLFKLFHVDAPINQKREIAWILSNIAAGSQKQIDLLFESGNFAEILVDAFNCKDHRVRKEIGWTVANAVTGASISRSRWLCSSNILSLMPGLLSMQNENDLVERVLRAIGLLISKRSNYIPVLDRYEIFKAVRQIAKNDYADFFLKERAEMILAGECLYNANRIPSKTYVLVR